MMVGCGKLGEVWGFSVWVPWEMAMISGEDDFCDNGSGDWHWGMGKG